MSDLRKYRYSKGYQRKFVAKACEITGDHLNDIEGGRVNLTNTVAIKLARVYGVDVDTIKGIYKESKNEK